MSTNKKASLRNLGPNGHLALMVLTFLTALIVCVTGCASKQDLRSYDLTTSKAIPLYVWNGKAVGR